jgi:hypothetical protein
MPGQQCYRRVNKIQVAEIFQGTVKAPNKKEKKNKQTKLGFKRDVHGKRLQNDSKVSLPQMSDLIARIH